VATAPAGGSRSFVWIASRSGLCLGRYCRRDRTRADYPEQLGFDRINDPQPAERDAARLAAALDAGLWCERPPWARLRCRIA